MKPLAAVYGRVSTGTQDNSLKLQDLKCLDYIRMKDLETPEALVFMDKAVSGGKAIRERPAGSRMMHVLESGYSEPGKAAVRMPVEHVVIAKLDRLGRKASDMLDFWAWAGKRGVTIHFVDLGGDSFTSQGTIGKLIFSILAMFAEFERDRIRERVAETIGAKFARGELIGTVPFGYDAVETLRKNPKNGNAVKELAVNPTELDHLRAMKDLFDGGWNYNQIAGYLNDLGVPTKKGLVGRWQTGNVKKILQSKHTQALLRRVTDDPGIDRIDTPADGLDSVAA